MGFLSRFFGRGSTSEEKQDAADLVADAIDWAEERFPPPERKFPNTPPAERLSWQLCAVAAALKVPLLHLEATGQDQVCDSTLETIRAELDRWHPQANHALSECIKVVDEYFHARAMGRVNRELFGGSDGANSEPDLGFALGMWMWQSVYGREPTPDEASDMYYVGQFVHASFVNYWNEGVRYVVITGSDA